MVKAQVEIKCTHCGYWNSEHDYCEECHQPISQKEIQKQEQQKIEQRPKVDKRDKLDESLAHLKNHRFLLVRIIFHMIYSTVWVFWVISSVFSMIVAFLSA